MHNYCKICGGTKKILTSEAEKWLSASGVEQAKMVRPDDHGRFVDCPVCVTGEESIRK